jgi:dTMP kinase
MRGMFISFEGPDGSGKSTHIRFLSEKLGELGYGVCVTREPGGCPISEKIREILLDCANAEMDPVTEALLCAADRAQHVAEVIRPALARGEIVVTDRYLDSSVAYQGYGRGLGADAVAEINAPATGGLMPDVTFFMSVDSGEAARRVSKREMDRFETAGADFHDRVAEAFEAIARENPGRVVTVDASEPKPAVHAFIMGVVLERLKAFADGEKNE